MNLNAASFLAARRDNQFCKGKCSLLVSGVSHGIGFAFVSCSEPSQA